MEILGSGSSMWIVMINWLESLGCLAGCKEVWWRESWCISLWT